MDIIEKWHSQDNATLKKMYESGATVEDISILMSKSTQLISNKISKYLSNSL